MEFEVEKIRLQVFLSRSGVASRRRSAEIIQQGKVKVNGETILDRSFRVDPRKDVIEYLDTRVKPHDFIFLKLFKPKGYVSTMKDERGRKSLKDLVKKEHGRVFPVGRLDYDSEGLIILTNHGEATNRMIHPRYHFPKIYLVRIDRTPTVEDLKQMSDGIEIDGVMTLPAVYELPKPGSKIVKVELREGRKRQIRRVFAQFGYSVHNLRRIAIGPIKLGDMKPGEIRKFTMKEIFQLLDMLDLSPI